MKKLKNKEKFVLSGKLLVDPTGKKMGKTEGNMVAFTDSASDAFGKIMSWPDSLMPLAYELCTDLEMPKRDPKESKLTLAKAIIASYWGSKLADEAQESWTSTFSKGEIPEDVREVTMPSGQLLADILLAEGLIASKTEWRRLVNEGAVSIGSEKVNDEKFKIEKSSVVRVGKHRFLKIVINF